MTLICGGKKLLKSTSQKILKFEESGYGFAQSAILV
jgi:hypothetical protein